MTNLPYCSKLRCSGARLVDRFVIFGGVMRCSAGSFSLASKGTEWKGKKRGMGQCLQGEALQGENRASGPVVSGPGQLTELNPIR